MVAPSRARRLPASRSIRARSPRCTNAVFSFSPVNLRASASNSSSMFNVVLIHIMMHVSYAHCKDFVLDVGFGAPPKQSFLLFCCSVREMGALHHALSSCASGVGRFDFVCSHTHSVSSLA